MTSVPPAEGLSGFILAGGGSSRFGTDKALALFRGKTLLERAIEILSQLGLSPSIVSPRVEPYRTIAKQFITKERPGLGPVEGLRVALEACRSKWAVVLPVDMPWVQPDLIATLIALRQEEDLAVCFRDRAGRRHPFPGLYHVSLSRELKADAIPGSMKDLLARARARLVPPEQVVGEIDLERALRNVNRPEDLRDADDSGPGSSSPTPSPSGRSVGADRSSRGRTSDPDRPAIPGSDRGDPDVDGSCSGSGGS